MRCMDRIFVRHWRLHDMENDRRLHGKLKLGSKIPFFKGSCNLTTSEPGRFLSRAAGDGAAERLVSPTRRWYDENNGDGSQGLDGSRLLASITQRHNGRCQVVLCMEQDGMVRWLTGAGARLPSTYGRRMEAVVSVASR
jgi:hypothetical protein